MCIVQYSLSRGVCTRVYSPEDIVELHSLLKREREGGLGTGCTCLFVELFPRPAAIIC